MAFLFNKFTAKLPSASQMREKLSKIYGAELTIGEYSLSLSNFSLMNVVKNIHSLVTGAADLVQKHPQISKASLCLYLFVIAPMLAESEETPLNEPKALVTAHYKDNDDATYLIEFATQALADTFLNLVRYSPFLKSIAGSDETFKLIQTFCGGFKLLPPQSPEQCLIGKESAIALSIGVNQQQDTLVLQALDIILNLLSNSDRERISQQQLNTMLQTVSSGATQWNNVLQDQLNNAQAELKKLEKVKQEQIWKDGLLVELRQALASKELSLQQALDTKENSWEQQLNSKEFSWQQEKNRLESEIQSYTSKNKSLQKSLDRSHFSTKVVGGILLGVVVIAAIIELHKLRMFDPLLRRIWPQLAPLPLPPLQPALKDIKSDHHPRYDIFKAGLDAIESYIAENKIDEQNLLHKEFKKLKKDLEDYQTSKDGYDHYDYIAQDAPILDPVYSSTSQLYDQQSLKGLIESELPKCIHTHVYLNNEKIGRTLPFINSKLWAEIKTALKNFEIRLAMLQALKLIQELEKAEKYIVEAKLEPTDPINEAVAILRSDIKKLEAKHIGCFKPDAKLEQIAKSSGEPYEPSSLVNIIANANSPENFLNQRKFDEVRESIFSEINGFETQLVKIQQQIKARPAETPTPDNNNSDKNTLRYRTNRL